MNESINKCVDTIFLVFGFSYGIEQIESLLGIIILSLQIIWLLSKMVVKIYHSIKEKNYDNVDDIINETINELKEKRDDVNE